jgi:hypothetical protein
MSPASLLVVATSTTLTDVPNESLSARPGATESRRVLPAVALPVASREEAPFEAPAPCGSDLITELIPYDRALLDESLARLLGRFGDETAPAAADRPTVRLPWVFATMVVALEATRRWHHRLTASGATEEWKKKSPTLHGLS